MLRLASLLTILAGVASAQNPIASDSPFQVRYATNLAIGDSVINMTNTGASAGGGGGSLTISGGSTTPPSTWQTETGQSIPTGTAGFVSGVLVAAVPGTYTFTYGGGGLLPGDTGHGNSANMNEFWVGPNEAAAEVAGQVFCAQAGDASCGGLASTVGQSFTVSLPAGTIPFGFTFGPSHNNVLQNGQSNNAIGAYLAQIGLGNTPSNGPGLVAYLGLSDLAYPADDDFQDFVVKVSATPNASNICANVYTFSPDEQEVSCCSCVVTPNGLVSLSVNNDLVSNTLTPAHPSSVVVKLLATTGGSCNAAAPGTPVVGLAAWGTTVHVNTSGASASMTESAFMPATLGSAELARISSLCGFIQANGSGFGICRSCRLGGLGVAAQ